MVEPMGLHDKKNVIVKCNSSLKFDKSLNPIILKKLWGVYRKKFYVLDIQF